MLVATEISDPHRISKIKDQASGALYRLASTESVGALIIGVGKSIVHEGREVQQLNGQMITLGGEQT